ncbi:MAG: DUF2254 domain-containing protein [Roseovarius sp.]
MTSGGVSAWAMLLGRLAGRLWVRVALFALLAVAGAALAGLFEHRIPAGLRDRFTTGSLLPILTILASGMLAVSTFSLNVMVSAHNAAARQTTPRVHRVLLADTTTQTVLAVFIGAFVYALSAIILIRSGFYPEGAGVLLLAMTVAVVVLVVLSLLRWIDHLSDLGSMDATLAAIEDATRGCLLRSRRLPALGGVVAEAGPPAPSAAKADAGRTLPGGAQPIAAPATGYVQFIDMRRIDALLGTAQISVRLVIRTGDYVIEGQVIGHARGLDDTSAQELARHLTIGPHRTFEQDAGYGLLVLSETASHALSPSINDPGTAIAVICAQERLLLEWAHARPQEGLPLFARISLPDVSRESMIENAFAGPARDGARQIEVVLRLQEALARLANAPDPALAAAARAMRAHARAHADLALPLASERARLRAANGDGGER